MSEGQISLESYSENKLSPPKALSYVIYHCAICGINLSFSVAERASSEVTVVQCKNGHPNRVD